MTGCHIIGLAGLRGSGKSEVANIILDETLKFGRHAKILALADPIKTSLALMISAPDRALFGPSNLRHLDSGLIDDRGNPISVRRLLTTMGNDWGRKLSRTFWVQVLLDRLKKVDSDSVVVVPDIRYENEMQALHAAGASIWRIHMHKRSRWEHLCDGLPILHQVGDVFGMSPHASEREMWYRRVDRYVTREIQNDGTLEELRRVVVRFLKE